MNWETKFANGINVAKWILSFVAILTNRDYYPYR